jgi:hypothetical protein
MSGGASISDVASVSEAPIIVSVVLSVVVVIVEAEVHAANASATRITMDMIVRVFFIFFSFVRELLSVDIWLEVNFMNFIRSG